jgi:hypothetical protein
MKLKIRSQTPWKLTLTTLGALICLTASAQSQDAFKYIKRIDPINDYDSSYIVTQEVSTPRGGFIAALVYRCEGSALSIRVGSNVYLDEKSIRAGIRFDAQPATFFGTGSEERWDVSTDGGVAFLPLTFVNRFVQRSTKSKSLTIRLERFDQSAATYKFSLKNFPRTFSKLGCSKTYEAETNSMIAYQKAQASKPSNPTSDSSETPVSEEPSQETASESGFVNANIPLVSAKEFAKVFGGAISFEDGIYYLSYGGTVVQLRVDSSTATLEDGTSIELDYTPIIRKGTLLIPASALSIFSCNAAIPINRVDAVSVKCSNQSAEQQADDIEENLVRY